MTSIVPASRRVIVASASLLAAAALLGMIPWQLAAAEPQCANEAKLLQGTWQVIDLQANGEKKPDDEIKQMQIIISGDDLVIKPDGEGRRCKFTLDTAKTPKAIDLVPGDGPSKGKTFPGIYSLQDGKLRLCINIFRQHTGQRPTEFKTQPGDGTAFVTLERVKQK